MSDATTDTWDPDTGSTRVIGCALAFIGLVAAGLLVLVGSFAWIGISDVTHQAALLDRAVETPAKVLSSGVETQTYTTGTSGGSRTSHTIYIPKVQFSYDFGGRSRLGERVYPTERNGDPAWAGRVVAQFPVNAEVSAWVDPKDPDDVFLIRELVVSSYAMILAAAGGVSLLMSFVALVAFLYRPVSRGAAAVGITVPVALVAFAGVHYWTHARQAGTGVGLPELLGALTLVSGVIPVLAAAMGGKWRCRLASQGEENE